MNESVHTLEAEISLPDAGSLYDRVQPVVAGPTYEPALEAMVELVPYPTDRAVRFTELGCGTGGLTRRLLERFPLATGAAVDRESALLELARRNIGRRSDRVDLRQGGLEETEIGPSDLVISACAFHHISPEASKEVLRRVARSLLPEGCLILMDSMTSGPPWGRGISGLGLRLYRRHVENALSSGRVTRAELEARYALKRRLKTESRSIEYRHTAEALLEAMLAGGFREAGLVWRSFAHTILLGFVSET